MIIGLPQQWIADIAPRIIMVHMPADVNTSRSVRSTVAKLSKSPGIVIQALELLPMEISSQTLHELMPSRISVEDSEFIYPRLAPLLDGNSPPSASVKITTNPKLLRLAVRGIVDKMLAQRGDDVPEPYPDACCNLNEATGMFSSNALCSPVDAVLALDIAKGNKRSGEKDFAFYVSQALRSAFAFHEMSPQHSAEVVTFVLSTRIQ
jgi:hypothetical protein